MSESLPRAAPLLHAAFDLDDQEARQEWIRWRETADLNALAPEELAALPLLSRRFLPWIEEDPAKPILLGICKQAWSRNQIRLRQLTELAAQLRRAGLDPVVTGTAAAVLLSAGGEGRRAEGGFLAIPRLELLLRREDIPAAVSVLKSAGWRGGATDVRNTASSVSLGDEHDGWCILRWRLLSSAPDVACEAAAMAKVETEWTGSAFTVPSPAWQLADRLLRADYPQWVAEALLVLPREIDWDEFRRALTWASAAGPLTQRLRELQDQWRVPLAAGAQFDRGKFASIRRDYRRWQAEDNVAGTRGILPYLRTRWDAPSNAQLPRLAMKMFAEFVATRSTGSTRDPSL